MALAGRRAGRVRAVGQNFLTRPRAHLPKCAADAVVALEAPVFDSDLRMP